MKLWHSLLYAGFLAKTVSGDKNGYYDKLIPSRVVEDIQQRNLENVLWNLNKIAVDNGGNRAFGLPGYKASVDFILERVQKRFGDELDTHIQKFTHLFETTRNISVKGPDGKDVYAISLMYNTATPLPDGITAPLVHVPVDDERGSGCFPEQWKGIDATGRIVLVKRGTCAIADKVKLAKAKGALAVILYNNTPGTPIGSATLGASNVGLLVPVGVVTLESGVLWSTQLGAGTVLEVTLLVDSVAQNRTSWNVISETKEGNPNNVVVLGAHLDSVQAGAGINDDGSGAAALLELAGSFTKYRGFPNKVRFIWWGAEESGLIGSLYYGQHLSEEEADSIRFYFNYDMIGSKEPIYAVYADTVEHATGGSHLLNYLKSRGKPAYYGGFGSSSDYVAFLQLGIPSSGIFTGAGSPYDSCYHQRCDDINNINWEALTVNTKAAGYAAALLALSLDGVPPRQKTSVNLQSKRGVETSLRMWAQTTQVIEKSHKCGGGGSGNNLV